MRRTASALPALTLPMLKLNFGYLIPFHRAIGMRLESIQPDTGAVVLRVPLRASNRNAAGTVHGAVIMALAESVHGAALAYGLREQHLGARIFTKRAELVFIKKGSS